MTAAILSFYVDLKAKINIIAGEYKIEVWANEDASKDRHLYKVIFK